MTFTTPVLPYPPVPMNFYSSYQPIEWSNCNQRQLSVQPENCAKNPFPLQSRVQYYKPSKVAIPRALRPSDDFVLNRFSSVPRGARPSLQASIPVLRVLQQTSALLTTTTAATLIPLAPLNTDQNQPTSSSVTTTSQTDLSSVSSNPVPIQAFTPPPPDDMVQRLIKKRKAPSCEESVTITTLETSSAQPPPQKKVKLSDEPASNDP